MNTGTKVSTRPKVLTLHYLLKEDLPIWVRNKTGTPGVSSKPGFITLQVGSGNNMGRVVVPPGDDPICLTDQIDPASLRSCRDLHSLVNASALELLDPDNADGYYEKNAERKQVVEDKISKYLRGEKNPVDVPKTIEFSSGALHPKLGDLCLKAKHNVLSERDMLEDLFEQAKAFGEVDYQYLINNGVYDGVRTWAREQLNAKKLGMVNDPIEQVGK